MDLLEPVCPEVTLLMLCYGFREQFISTLTSVLFQLQINLFFPPNSCLTSQLSMCPGGIVSRMGCCFQFVDDQHKCKRGCGVKERWIKTQMCWEELRCHSGAPEG